MRDELADPQRHRSVVFYVVLIFLVLPLWAAVPSSWLFVLYAVVSQNLSSFSWLGWTLFGLAFCEVLFSVYHWRLAESISGPSPYGPGNLAELQTAFTRVLKAGLADWPLRDDDESLDFDSRPASPNETITLLQYDDPRAIDFRVCLRNWFRRAPWPSVRLHQIQQWIYWSIFNADLPAPDAIPPSHRSAMDEAVAALEKRLGGKIPAGSNPDFPPIRLTLDKVNVHWRPFAHYLIVNIINRCLHFIFRRFWRMQHGSYDGLEYLVRFPTNWDPITGPRPIVLIHGLGLGLLQYNALIRHFLKAFPDRPLLILLQPHISQNIFHPRFLRPFSRHETTYRLARLLSQLFRADLDEDAEEKQVMTLLTSKCKKGVIMVSHSNGSYSHAWMLKEYPELIARSCFVDPVTFCSWEGDVCYNFIYRPCTTGIELLMRYFVGTELGVANLLQRHFDWSSNSLFFEEIPHARDITKTLFILGGKDDIVNAERVKRYLTSHGVRKNLWLYPNSHHGQALISGQPGHAELFSWINDYDN